jgi:hypothetical protein
MNSSRTALFLVLTLTLVAAHLVVEAQDEEPSKHNPLQGMDPSGRIPKITLPDDLPNPERWRYVPEGRIKPGNVLERFMASSFIAPLFFYEQDIGFGGGFALTDIDFRTERRREFLGAFFSYTTEGQQKYRLYWRRWLHHRDLPEGGVLVEERSHVDAYGGYEKSLTRRFFGLGPDTRARDETSYLDEVIDLGVRGDFALPQAGANWIATVGARGEYHNLGPGRVSGRPTTADVFPDLFAAGDNHSSFIVSAGLRYDTRDSQHQPYAGYQIGLQVDAALWQSTGNAGAVATAFGNGAIPLPPLFHRGGDGREENPPTDTLALGVAVQGSAGSLPFYELPSLGGIETLRGYIANRFTGNASWHAVAEYRLWLFSRGFALTDTIRFERIGMALFYEAGTVADAVDRLFGSQVHHSYGLGLRFALERTALLRADVGFSTEDINVTVGFGLSF